jgi:hypothetical protein
MKKRSGEFLILGTIGTLAHFRHFFYSLPTISATRALAELSTS